MLQKLKKVQKMLLCRRFLGSVKQRGGASYRTSWNLYFLLLPAFAVLLFTTLKILSLLPEVLWLKLPVSAPNVANSSIVFPLQNPQKNSLECGQCHLPCSSLEFGCRCNSTHRCPILTPPPMYIESKASPYHNWLLFNADYQEMLQTLKIFVYPDVFMNKDSSPFASVFLPHPDPLDPKIGNYFSEHAFKLALLKSSLITQRPEEAHFFFMPFSINAMRNHPLLHSESSISNFIAQYILRISSEFEFWNASGGSNHFFICCHSVGREAASNNFDLRNNAIQITCSSSYFQRLYSAHKDIALPQVWPRAHHQLLNPLNARNKLVFFAGRVQNSRIRKEILSLWANDTSFSIFSKNPSFPYEEGFRRSKYCLHVKGYEVNTARVSDSIHYGCIPVLISDHYDLPFANVLDWSKFSIIVSQGDIGLLKYILTTVVSQQMYMNLYNNLRVVSNHFRWYTDANALPTTYDSFHMTAYQLWLRRGLQSNRQQWSKWRHLCRPKGVGGMGFRNLIAFNKALLAKQVWRIVNSPNSLMSRTLKGRYFKNADIMTATMGSNPSYVWKSLLWSRGLMRKSLLWSRGLMKKGLCWRVGNGHEINAKLDSWISGLPTFTSRFNQIHDNTTKVEHFISTEGTWKEDEIRRVFPTYEAEAILDIPINRRGSKDLRFWTETKNGKYAVKSGYIMEINGWSVPDCQSVHPDIYWWKMAWKLRIPPKIRIFLWCASKDFIPTTTNLAKHHVPIAGSCSLCKFHSASTSHCMLFCPVVRNAWKKYGFWSLLKNRRHASFFDCMLYLSKMLKQDELELVVMLAWGIWKEFCRISHDELRGRHGSINVDWVLNFVENYHKFYAICEVQESDTIISPEVVWKPPMNFNLRLDVDAEVDFSKNIFSVRLVVRDALGLIRGAKAHCIRNPGSVKGVELIAIRSGMDFCQKLSFTNVIIFSDSMEAVTAVQSLLFFQILWKQSRQFNPLMMI